MKKLILTLLSVTLFFVSCNNDDETEKIDDTNKVDTTAPNSVSQLEVTPMNGAVKITWTNPSDDDFKLTRIMYNDETIDVEIGNEKLIEGLTNGTSYVFYVSTVDINDNISDPIEISATPDYYLQIIEGEQASGKYKCVDPDVNLSIEINNNQYYKVEPRNRFAYKWEGTWTTENDTTYQYNLEFYKDSGSKAHLANIVSKINIALSYSYSDTTFYVEGLYEKKEGPDGLLPGKYQSYRIDESSDDPSYNEKIINDMEIKDSGSIYYTDGNGTNVTTWSEEDIQDGRFVFVSYNSRTYLVVRGINQRFYKE